MNSQPQKNILIYANSSTKTGAGHIMRQLGVAQCFRDKALKVTFVSHYCLPEIKNRILTLGFDFLELNSAGIAQIVKKRSPDALLIDDYQVSEKLALDISSLGLLTVWFDDDANIYPLSTDIVINSAEDCPICQDRIHLTGLQYRMIRPEFINQRQRMSLNVNYSQERSKLLISVGATDVANLVLPLTKALLECLPQLEVDLVLGASCSSSSAISALKANYTQLTVHEFVEDMSLLMAQSCMAVSNAGGTLYELACLGVPTIGLVVANNQASILNSSLKDKGIKLIDCRGVNGNGSTSGELMKSIVTEAESLWHNKEERFACSHSLMRQVDGQGIHRIADIIVKSLKSEY